MSTNPYVPFDASKPDGTAGTTTTYSAGDLANMRAVRDGLLCGYVPGYSFSESPAAGGTGTIYAPQFRLWTQVGGTTRFRLTCTYDGTITYMPVTAKWEYSEDSGVNYVNMNVTNPTINLTWSTTAGNPLVLTAVDRDFGYWCFALNAWVAAARVAYLFAAHATSGGGDTDHALGTAAHASLAAMAIAGSSSFDGTGGLGQTTPMLADLIRVRENQSNSGNVNLIGSGGTYTPDCNTGSYFKVQPNATTSATLTIAAPTNPPSAAKTHTITIEIVNGQRDIDGRITWNGTYHWIGGTAKRPLDNTLEASGSNLFGLTWNGATWDIVHLGKRG